MQCSRTPSASLPFPSLISFRGLVSILHPFSMQTTFSRRVASLLTVLVVGPNHTHLRCRPADQAHINKGAIGLHLQGAKQMDISGLTIKKIVSVGKAGVDSCGVYERLHSALAGKPVHPADTGYSGQNAYGIVVNAARSIRLHDDKESRVVKVLSKGALASGVLISGHSNRVDLNSLKISKVSGSDKGGDLVGQYPSTCDMRVLGNPSSFKLFVPEDAVEDQECVTFPYALDA